MPVVLAAVAFLLDVDHFAMRRNFAVLASDATATQRGETQKPYQTHHGEPSDIEPKSNPRTAELSPQAAAFVPVFYRERRGARQRDAYLLNG
jgi:hypothetical protein